MRGWADGLGVPLARPDIDLVAHRRDLGGATETTRRRSGGEITWRANEKLRFITGSYYSLYKHDLFVVDEREDVTTIFLRAVLEDEGLPSVRRATRVRDRRRG